MDTLQQVKLEKIEGLLQVLVNLLDKKTDTSHLEIMTQKQVLKELNISPNTLKSWERKGLHASNLLLKEHELYIINVVTS